VQQKIVAFFLYVLSHYGGPIMPFPTTYNPYNFQIIHTVDAANRRTTRINRVAVAGRGAPEIESVSPNDGSKTVHVLGENFISWDALQNDLSFIHTISGGPTTGTTVLTREQIIAAGGFIGETEVLVPEALLPDETLMRLAVNANNRTSSQFVIL